MIVDLFREERGRQFDPALVDILLGKLDEFLEIRRGFLDGVPKKPASSSTSLTDNSTAT